MDGARILVCEDEPFIALDLALAVVDAGGQVVGPAASIREAKAALQGQTVSGAILDVNLSDGDITPVAEQLLESGVPVVIQTGVGLPQALQERYPSLKPVSKPVSPDVLIARLTELMCRSSHT